MTAAHADVLIIGAGLVGASLARALDRSGLEIALVEPAPPVAPSDDWDARMYALSPASQAYLERLGVWSMLPRDRLGPVREMQVRGDRASELTLSAYDAGVERLATIVESTRLQHGLWTLLAGQSNLRRYPSARPAGVEFRSDAVAVTLDDGSRIEAKLLVGADGARSWVREAAGIATKSGSFGQLGVVANFACERQHAETAFQWFRADGILAWLPLPGKRISMVWSTPEAHAHELLALDPEQFCRRVEAAGASALGALQLITPPASFPLENLSAAALSSARVALAGDAAHVIHPLAGQGVNLGFGDAEALAQVLGARGAVRDAGDSLLLRRYGRRRAEAILAMRAVTRGLERLFAARIPGLARLRNTGLDLTDGLPVLKTLLMRHALAN